MYYKRLFVIVLLAPLFSSVSRGLCTTHISGEMKKWHKVIFTFDGPMTTEVATPNPFTDYRLQVLFTGPDGRICNVPGFYAADGNASETSATSGNKWRVHFVPDQEGRWNYIASFRTGPMVNISLDLDAGTSAGYCDGAAGSFTIGPSDKSGNDFRAKGMLRYVGKHHLRFAGTGEYYLKGGADSPENFLGYFEFDGTYDNGRLSPSTPDGLHHYESHVADWNPADPTWQGDKGKGIIGAINYLSSRGINSIYFLTYNVDGGDGMDTWIWTDHNERWRIDVSKLSQWEIVFSHMDAKGIQLHVVTSEAENHSDLGSGFSDMRKLYYRELVARFSHHQAVIWNIGEENGNSDDQRKAFAAYIRALDPYNHPITVHTYSGKTSTFYNGILGDDNFEATSIQGSGSNYNAWAIELRQKSAQTGRKWAIYGDEQGPAVNKNMNNLDTLRKGALWGNLMGGGAGVEWYFGYQGDFADCGSEDWHVAEPLWDMTRIALDFFQNYLPFWDMEPDNSLTSVTNDYCLAKPGQIYAVYLPSGGTSDLILPAGEFTVKWYNPRIGGDLQDGSVTSLTGPGTVSVGQPPNETNSDWTVLIAVETTTPSADLNHDGWVDSADLAIMAADWLRCNDPADPDCENAFENEKITELSAATAPSLTLVEPITNVDAGVNGSAPYMLQSVTVGDYTVAVDQLRTGVSTGYAGFGTEITAADDFDLNNIAARNDNSQTVWQITMIGGKSTWRDTNGDNPDFFIFEAGMNDDIEIRAILLGGILGEPVSVPMATWGDTGLNKVGSPNQGQNIGGIAFSITSLLDNAGLTLTNDSVIEGIQVTSGTLDQSNFCAVVMPGPLSYWKMNEGSGIVVADSVDNGFPSDGTYIGTVKWVVGPNPTNTAAIGIDFSAALGFAGSDYVDCGNDPNFNVIKENLTLAAWVNVAPGRSGHVINKGNCWGLSIEAETGKVIFKDPCSTATAFTSVGTVAAGRWHHVAGVYDGSESKIYIDGALDSCRPSSGSYNGEGNSNDSVQIGFSYVGSIDEVMLAACAFNVSEIWQLAGFSNLPPVANAGKDMGEFLRADTLKFYLDANVTDDGKPAPLSITTTWTVQKQPTGSSVIFDPHTPGVPTVSDFEDPTVTVDMVGSYMLRLTATDGADSSYDEITLTVAEPSCEYIRNHGMLLETDLTGPDIVPDCYVDWHDIAFLANYWLTHEMPRTR